MNPLIKFLIKQIEETGIVVENATRTEENADQLIDAFNDFYDAVQEIKTIIEDVIL